MIRFEKEESNPSTHNHISFNFIEYFPFAMQSHNTLSSVSASSFRMLNRNKLYKLRFRRNPIMENSWERVLSQTYMQYVVCIVLCKCRFSKHKRTIVFVVVVVRPSVVRSIYSFYIVQKASHNGINALHLWTGGKIDRQNRRQHEAHIIIESVA